MLDSFIQHIINFWWCHLVREIIWVTSVKCVVCEKTGKVPDPNDSEKQIKCLNCEGYGMITTHGKTKAD